MSRERERIAHTLLKGLECQEENLKEKKAIEILVVLMTTFSTQK